MSAGETNPRSSTRVRIIDEAMRLFGERGYAGTTVADIEAASGLASGAGGLYRHFRSKQALLEAGVRRQIEANSQLLLRMQSSLTSDVPLSEQLRGLAEAGIERLELERDLNRLLLRDLRHFPELLAESAQHDIRPVHEGLAVWISSRDHAGVLDAPAVAAVLAGATAHFWLLCDIFGEHPTDVSQDRYVAALVTLMEAALAPVAETE